MNSPDSVFQDRNKCADLVRNISEQIQKHMDMSRMLIHFVTFIHLNYN